MNNYKIEKIAKELCDKSPCHHKCHDTTDCVVEDEVREHLPFMLTNEEKVSEKEKQIEEIAVKLNEIIRFDDKGFVDRYATAEALYNAGYRKQSEGEWIHDINNLYGCSNCLGRETMSPKKLKPFCPNCGAKMKGGEE